MTKRSIDRLLKFKTLNTSEISNNYLFVSLVFYGLEQPDLFANKGQLVQLLHEFVYNVCQMAINSCPIR